MEELKFEEFGDLNFANVVPKIPDDKVNSPEYLKIKTMENFANLISPKGFWKKKGRKVISEEDLIKLLLDNKIIENETKAPEAIYILTDGHHCRPVDYWVYGSRSKSFQLDSFVNSREQIMYFRSKTLDRKIGKRRLN
jgi:hypothetical protein